MDIVSDTRANRKMQAIFTQLLTDMGGSGARTMREALATGVTIVGFNPTNAFEENFFGAYDSHANAIYLNLKKFNQAVSSGGFINASHGALATIIHECQHALNYHGGKVHAHRDAVLQGEEAFLKNLQWDEAYAWAQTYIFAQEFKLKTVLNWPSIQEIFGGYVCDAQQPNQFDHYAKMAHAVIADPEHHYQRMFVDQYAHYVEGHDDRASTAHRAWQERTSKRDPLVPDGSQRGVVS